MSLAIPHPRNLLLPHLFLQLKNAIKKSFGGGRAARDIDINRQNTVDTAKDTVAVVIVTPTISTAAHAYDPLGVWHLVVAKPDSRSHLVGDSTGDDHDVGLARGGAEDDAQAVLVVAWHGAVHHLDAAAC